MIPIETSIAGVRFKVKVHSRARKNGITGFVGDALKVSVASPPVDGKANQAVIEFLAEEVFKIPRSSVTIASGENSRLKGISVSGMSAEQISKALALKME